MSIRVGLIGCGGMGNALASQVAEYDGAEVVAVADLDAARRAEAAGKYGATAYEQYAELIDSGEVDAVFVATPGGYHRPPVEAAAAAGLHVFCEKPLATTVADADAMVAAAGAAGIKAMVGQVCRYHPTHRRLKQMIDEGPLGPLHSLYVERVGGGWGDTHPAWRYSRQLSGGNLLEINAHEIDFMCWLAGPVSRVYAAGGNYCDDRLDFADAAFVALSFASGAAGVLQSTSITTLGSYAGRFDCRDGSALVKGLFGGEIQYKLRAAEAEAQVVSPEEMKTKNPVAAEVHAWLDSIAADQPVPVPFDQARHVVAVAEAAYESIATGRAVELR